MAKYDVTFSCGHTETVNLIGKIKDRERKIEWFENQGLCSACWEAERKRQFEEQNRKAAEEAKEYGLPELTGTEKQVAWANTLRQNWIAEAEKWIQHSEERLERKRFKENPEEAEKLKKAITGMRAAMEARLLAETSARFWIDNRYEDIIRFLEKAGEKALQEAVQVEVPREVQQAALEEMTIRPEKPTTSLVAEIRISDILVTVKYPEKNDVFREIVKKLGFTWADGQWQRKTNFRTGSPLNRAAELGVKLLAAGFPVRVFSDELQQKILASDYEPECKRWITKHIKTGKFLIDWERPDDFFDEAKKLPGARWEREAGMLVPKEAFREVLDFANHYQFRLSSGAQELAKEARKAYETAMVAEVKPKAEQPLPKPGRKNLKAVDVTGEIDDELRDDD